MIAGVDAVIWAVIMVSSGHDSSHAYALGRLNHSGCPA